MRDPSKRNATGLLAFALFSFACPTPAAAQISVDLGPAFSADSRTLSVTYDASGSDKLVVVVTGEHGFNNDQGNCTEITYDGVLLTQLIDRNPIAAQTDTTYNDIWYLDNPASSTGLIVASVVTRGSITVFGLSGTAEGAGATVIGDPGTQTAELTTTATGSVVIASYGMGGSGNTADSQNVDAESPLTESSALLTNVPNRPWCGHVTGWAILPSVGANNFSYTGGNSNGAGAHIIAAEFLSADGTAGPSFAITEFDYDPDTELVTLTWLSTPDETYAVLHSTDLENWDGDFDDSVMPDLGETTTRSYDASGLAVDGKLLIRVEQNEK